MIESQQNKMHPFFLNLERIPLVIVGNSHFALEIVNQIWRNSISKDVRIFNSDFSQELLHFCGDKPHLVLIQKKLEEKDLKDFSLLIIATDDFEYEESLLKISQNKNVLVHVVGKTQISDFSLVSVLKKDFLKLGISSNYYSPEVRKRINRIIENSLPTDLDEFIEKLNFATKNPLMNKEEELKNLDRITAEYLEKKEKTQLSDSEFENFSKVNKAVRRRANIYLGIIGSLLSIAILSFILFEFQLFPTIAQFLNQDHHLFYKMLGVGFFAEIVAGSMGMGYGVICTTILLMMNVAPPVVSSSIHSAESFTSLAGSISHFKLKNVNKKLVKALAIPAVFGAILGAVSLSYFGEHYVHFVKPIISLYTLYLGINILKNAFKKKEKKILKHKSGRNITTLGLLGGFVDSFAGGGWGPMVTGTLLKEGRTPRYVIGSSTMAKFILTVTSAFTFALTIGVQHWNIILGLLIGGIVTAPFSAMLTSRLPIKKMFVIIGFLIIIMSLLSIYKSFV